MNGKKPLGPPPQVKPATPEQQEAQQAIQAVNQLYEITAQTPAPRNVHIQAEQLRNMLIGYLTRDEPKGGPPA